MAAMHKLVYKMYMDKIEDMEKDKDEMQRLTELLNNPESEFVEEETQEMEQARVTNFRISFYLDRILTDNIEWKCS